MQTSTNPAKNLVWAQAKPTRMVPGDRFISASFWMAKKYIGPQPLLLHFLLDFGNHHAIC